MKRLALLVVLLLPAAACRRRLAVLPEPHPELYGQKAVTQRKSEPPPPAEREREKPKPEGGPMVKTVLGARRSDARREQAPLEGDAEETIMERYRASTAAASGLSQGGRPDEGDPKGRPAVRRPEEETLASPGPPSRYRSPKPLKELRGGRRMPRIHGAEFGEEADADEPASNPPRPKTAPPISPILDDSLPPLGIADPDIIGAYRVQIATSSHFPRILFDKTYPFMTEVDLSADLAGAPERFETLWIRYAVVDLLDFEHPFTRPRRIVRVGYGEGRGY